MYYIADKCIKLVCFPRVPTYFASAFIAVDSTCSTAVDADNFRQTRTSSTISNIDTTRIDPKNVVAFHRNTFQHENVS